MKVLYLGHYRDCSGWGQAAIDYILSLDKVDVDVVCRPVKLNQSTGEIPKRVEELEAKDTVGVTHVIQHVLPHHMDYNHRVHNIALYATETSHFRHSGWPRKINQLDEAWVINNRQVKASKDSGVTIPISVVPHACDTAKFAVEREPLDIPQAQGNFLFYFIGDLTKRKNLPALITAFHTEFSINEPVSLLIKTNKYGLAPQECAEQVSELCTQIKTGLKMYRDIHTYKREIILTGYIPEEELMRLHVACDCFVMPSYGEAWCIPAFDAMGFGNTPICTDVGGMSDFLSSFVGDLLVGGSLEVVCGMNDTFPKLCTGREYWHAIDVVDLRYKMRCMYENGDKEGLKYHLAEHSLEYSYENVGTTMLEKLNEV